MCEKAKQVGQTMCKEDSVAKAVSLIEKKFFHTQ